MKYFKRSMAFMHCRTQLWSLWACDHCLSSIWRGTTSYRLSLQPFATQYRAWLSFCLLSAGPEVQGGQGTFPTPCSPLVSDLLLWPHQQCHSQLVSVSNQYWIASQSSLYPAHNLGISEEAFVLSCFLSL